MNTYTDRRACERLRYAVAIEFSYFNMEHCYKAQTLNYCDEGMSFKSEVPLRPGSTVCVRVKNFPPDSAGSGDSRGLHSLSLAEAKGCNEIVNEAGRFYEIGVKYYHPEY